MSTSILLNLPVAQLHDEDFFLNDEELMVYLEELYYPKALKKDRIKRFRNS